MKPLGKKILFLAIISCVILFIIYKPTLKNIFQKDKVYILFNVQKDKDTSINWARYTDLFPKNFNPNRTIVDISELSKLNKRQKLKYDSIRNIFYKYPCKIIPYVNKSKKSSLSITKDIAVAFKILNKKEIKKSKINSLNILSLDSIIKLIPDLDPSQSSNIEFYILELEGDKGIIKKVRPYLIEYN